jgi:hypothetical protein
MKPEAESFYKRRAWITLRYQILNKYDARCMLCGIGRESGVAIQVDHIRPISIYPELALCEDNLQVLCANCNQGKSNSDIQDFRPKLAVVPKLIDRDDPIEKVVTKLKRDAAILGSKGDDVKALQLIQKIIELRRETSKPGLSNAERINIARRFDFVETDALRSS